MGFQGVRSRVARVPPWVGVVAITAVFAVVAWSGVQQWGTGDGDDAYTYRDYVAWLDVQHRIPRRDQNYEYALPIGVPIVGLGIQRAFGQAKRDATPSPPFQALPKLLRRLLWIALVIGGALALARARPPQPRWLLGLGAWLAAGAWAAAYVDTSANNEPWLPLVLVSYAAGVALVPVSAWLAHEVWPQRRAAPVLAALAATLMPVVFASTLYFHPDPPFALLSVIAVALVVRALRKGLSIPVGALAGITLGAAALARQSAPVIAVSLVVAVALIARRSAWRYLTALAGGMLVVAGPWWYQQIERYGNPIQANLNRPGYMIDHEPFSFFVSFPTELVTHPYVPAFGNDLLPRFHAYLWSDWGGGYHHWGSTTHAATVLASVQSVLGLGGDALVLGGVALLGVPALLRTVRGRDTTASDSPLAVLTTLFLLSWAAFIATLVRFPQRDGDPIKAHYLLFLAPVCAVFALAAGIAMSRRGGWRRGLLYAWVCVYAVSWMLTFATAF